MRRRDAELGEISAAREAVFVEAQGVRDEVCVCDTKSIKSIANECTGRRASRAWVGCERGGAGSRV